jgi:putative ABC transport system permease protein
MDNFLRDLRYGFRMLRRAPAMSAIAVLALALGIGANSAIFSVVYAVLLRPLPVSQADRLVAIQAYNPKFNIPPINPSYSSYGAWQKQASSFQQMAASWAGTADLATDRSTEKVVWWRVTASFFPVMGVQPALGRWFAPEEDRPGAPRVALLGYDLWQRRFGADRAVIGKTLRLNDETFTIVGVAPRRFHIDGKPPAVYAAIAQDPADRKRYLPITGYGRLRPGVTLAQAQSEMDAVANRLDERGFGWKARVWNLRDSMAHDVRLSLLVLLGAVGLVLLIACANIASLLLARSSARQREIAIRTAIGAPRSRLLAQFLTESTLLGVLGGAAGLLLAAWSMRLIPLLENDRLPTLLLDARVDPVVLAFTMAISVATGMLFGIAPALSAAPVRVQETLRQRGRKRMWSTLVVSETALALMLMIGATLLIRSFFYLRDSAPGFRVDGLLSLAVTAPKGQDAIAHYEQLLAQVRAVPGVISATLATTLPLDGNFQSMSLKIEGLEIARPQDFPVLWHRTVESEYFRTLGIPLKRGRFFTPQDRDGATRVAIVNEAMARRFWPGQDAVGKHLGNPAGREYFEIVGVVADVRFQDATKDGLVEVFFPYLQAPPSSAVIAVRADRRLAPVIAKTVGGANVRDMLQVASDRLAPKRLTASVIAVFAGLALLLAAVGIYGVLSFTVAQRTHEIGIRMALGAERSGVVRMIVGQAAGLAAIGVAIGVAGALALSRVLATLVFGVSTTDPFVFAEVSATLIAVAAFAAWVPARRAAQVDPVIALRSE